MAATFMLKALDYEVADYNASVVQAAGVGIEIAAATEMTRAQGFQAMWSTVNLPKSGSTVALGVERGKNDAPNVGDLEVAEIKAASAKSFTVKFNKAVADTDKVTFSVKRLTTESTVTVAWNEDKTEATLSSASNFPESTFTVAVMMDEKEVAKETIEMTAQKVAKIDIVSETLSATVDTNTGYVNYKVYDQYENDITSTAKANSLSYQFGLSGYNVTLKNGLMKIDGSAAPVGTTKLITVQSVSVVIYDSSAGVTATAGLPVSTAVGTLTSFTLGSVEDVKLVEGDTTSVYYVPYTAVDMSGTETKDFELVKNGLIDSDTTTSDIDLVVSLSNNVTAKVVQDPANSKLAAIEVKYKTSVPASNFVMDMPVTITAMTYGGNSSVVNTTIAKATNVETIYLMAPAETVATGETPEIPFEAYDQNGNKMTSHRYVNATTINATGFTIVERADGTAKFVMTAVNSKGLVTLSANVVKSGKVSNLLSINVQNAAVPTSVGFKQDKLVSAMEQTASQKIDFTGGSRAIVVYDQYDRVMGDSDVDAAFGLNDNDDDSEFYILATVTGNATLDDDGIANVGAAYATTYNVTDTSDLYVNANNIAGGYATIKFELKQDTTGTDKVWDAASTAVSVIATADVEGYQINSSDSALYAVDEQAAAGLAGGGTITAQEAAYAFTAKVYGETANGTKVFLAGMPVVAASLSNATDFYNTPVTSSAAYNAVDVTAKDLNNNRTSATTDLVITVAHNNVVKPLKVAIASSTTTPVAKEIALEGADSDGIVDDWTAATGIAGAVISAYDTAGTATASPFYFAIDDSYGTDGMYFVSFDVSKVVKANGTVMTGAAYGVTLTNTGVLTVAGNGANADDTIYVTAVTNNGLSSTAKIVLQ
jgi:hypothetical protein